MCTSRKRQDYSRLSIKKQDYICIRTSRRGEGYSCISPKGQNYIYISPEGQDYSCISIGKDGLQQHYRQNQSCQSPEGQNNNCTEVGLQLQKSWLTAAYQHKGRVTAAYLQKKNNSCAESRITAAYPKIPDYS
jgi:hypothetical protein